MRGFLVGSLALVVVYVLVQPNTAKAAAGASGLLVSTMRRFLSPDVSGIPQRNGS